MYARSGTRVASFSVLAQAMRSHLLRAIISVLFLDRARVRIRASRSIHFRANTSHPFQVDTRIPARRGARIPIRAATVSISGKGRRAS